MGSPLASTCFLRPLSSICQASQGRPHALNSYRLGPAVCQARVGAGGSGTEEQVPAAPELSEEVTDLGRHNCPGRGFIGRTELDSDPGSLVPVLPASDQMGDVSRGVNPASHPDPEEAQDARSVVLGRKVTNWTFGGEVASPHSQRHLPTE